MKNNNSSIYLHFTYDCLIVNNSDFQDLRVKIPARSKRNIKVKSNRTAKEGSLGERSNWVNDLTNLNQIVSDHGGENVEDLKEIGKKFASLGLMVL
jgi:hypothetical protein